MAKTSLDKKTVEHQFDTLVKKVLAGEAKDLKAKAAKQATHETTFSEMNDNLVENFCAYDEHSGDYFLFEILGSDVVIKNELLGEAVTNLPERKRIIKPNALLKLLLRQRRAMQPLSARYLNTTTDT